MKFIIAFLLSLLQLFSNSQAQDYYSGLYSNNYYEPAQPGTGQLKLINKNICIVYNRGYCMFYEENRGASFFSTRNYTTSLQGKYLHTSFVSQETNTTPDGYYGIMIDEDRDGIHFQVSLPNGQTYLATKARRYNSDGTEIAPIKITNYKENIARLKYEDSLSKAKLYATEKVAIQKKIDDSLFLVKRDSTLIAIAEANLNKGNNFNPVSLNSLALEISKKIKTKNGEYFYSDYKVLIDKNGIIVDAFPMGTSGNVLEKYLPLVKNELLNQVVTPYKHKNGKTYPSYAQVYITLVSN